MNSRQTDHIPVAEPDVVERVAAELRRMNWSMREVERRSGVSNTTLAKFLEDGRITRKVRDGYAKAFGWELDWPENPPSLPEQRNDEVISLLMTLLARIDELERKVDQLDR